MAQTKEKRHTQNEDEDPPALLEFERTLAVIKPNAISKSKAIESIIERAGLMILNRRRIYLKPEQARDFYIQSTEDEDAAKYYKIYEDLMKSSEKDDKGIPVISITDVEDITKGNVEEFVDFMTSGPIEILVLAGRGAVSKWLSLIGPENPKKARETCPDSIRAKFGGETVLRNAVHGSESATRAEKEIKFFFPETKYDIENKIGTSGEYLSKTVNPILLKGLIQLCRQKPDNPLVWLADWLLANNPNTKA